MEKELAVAIKYLKKVDPVIRELIANHGSCTLYDDNSLMHQSKFHVLAWAIINQQLSVQSARSIENKLLNKLSSKHFEPEAILTLKQRELSACGLSRQKIRYLRTLGELVQTKQLILEGLNGKSNDSISDTLIEIPGIGPWTIDMFLIFSMGRLDVLPLGDLALRKSLALHYHLPNKAALDEYEAIAQVWQPYQTIASWYLWLAVD